MAWLPHHLWDGRRGAPTIFAVFPTYAQVHICCNLSGFDIIWLLSEFEVRNKCDAMVENGMRDAGYNMMLLDDCWAAHDRDENDELQPMPDFFPSGMKALADYLHERGMKLGLYTCVGTETCKRNRPGSYGHFETDANTFAKWGVDMVKADYCNRPSNESGKDLYYQFSDALNATGHPMLFATCQWGEDNVVEWGGEVAQMFRIQMDHIPVYNGPDSAAGMSTLL